MVLGALLAIGAFVVLLLVILLGLIVFWLWMLIDVLKRKKFEDKLVWVIVMILLPILGSIIYYFLVKAKEKKK